MAVVDIDETEVIGEAHWTVFLPVVAFAVLFAGFWFLLDVIGRGGTMPGRFAFLVAVLVTPLLTLLSFLRYQTIRVSRSFDGLWVERGWPDMTPRHVPFGTITEVAVSTPIVGRHFGAGHLTVFLQSGESITVRDLANISALSEKVAPASTPEDRDRPPEANDRPF